jgi:hypothetical protein
VEWATAWEDPSSNGTGGNILDAACRPATFLQYMAANLPSSEAMCAQGSSAGSAALGYVLAWYGGGTFLKNVELLSGPVLSEIDQGCTYPNATNYNLCPANGYCTAKTLPWSDNIIYVPNYNTAVSNWSGIPACATSKVNSANYPTWAAMSIVDGSSTGASPVFKYPSTYKHGWLCSTLNQTDCGNNSCPNNSPSEGALFYDALYSAGDPHMSVTRVTGCSGAEGITQGTDPDHNIPAPQAIQDDMQAFCKATQ